MDMKVSAICLTYTVLGQTGGLVPNRVLQAAKELKVPVFVCDEHGNKKYKVTKNKKGQQLWTKAT